MTEAEMTQPIMAAGAWPQADEETRSGVAAWHVLLLRLAGSLPDELISEARTWLAEGGTVDVAQAVGFAVAAGRIPVRPAEASLMADALRAEGEGTDLIDGLERLEEDAVQPLPWEFTPNHPDDRQPGTHPGPVDLTSGEEPLDDTDRAIALAAAEPDGQVMAVWRAWRSPTDRAPWPAPRRVYVVQAGPDATGADLVAVTDRLQTALVEAGEESPQVEVCGPGTPVPGYQSTACAYAALVWAEEPAVPVQLARVFDAVDPMSGPMFVPDHPVVADAGEILRLLGYLGRGLPVLTSSATMGDILDPEQPDVVPLTFRTDGEWVWTDTIIYYLEHYGLAPEPELLAHLRIRLERTDEEDPGPEVSDVALHRVLSFLQRPDNGEPVWTVPQASAAPWV